MPHYKSTFKSKFLSAAEIETPYDANIAGIAVENVGTDDKPEKKLVAHFFNPALHKPIVLNQTRCEAVADLAGTPDYEQWSGTRVHVSQGSTRFNGQKVACIVLGPPAPVAPPRKDKPARSPKPAAPVVVVDDDPF